MAAYALIRRLVSNGISHEFEITVLGEEPRPPYDRVNLTDAIQGKSAEQLELASLQWYADHDIELLTSERAKEINRTERFIRTDSGLTLNYDRLVFATGSRPFVPPIEGTNLPGVFVYRTIEDIGRIRDFAGRCTSAAVLGGGLLGLEAAKALHDLNLQTHILEVAPSLMPRQLNTQAGVLLKQEVEQLGVKVHLQKSVLSIVEDNSRLTLQLLGDDLLTVDMVVISAGIRPRDELAAAAGLPLGQRGGIAINQHLQTADPRIYALGECVSLNGRMFGLVGPCYDMAHVLADNLTQERSADTPEPTAFEAVAQASRLKLMGVDVSTLGIPIGEAEAASAIVHQGEKCCRTLLLEKKRLVGAIGVGPWPERERLSGAIAARQKLGQRQMRRFREHGVVWSDSEGDSVLDWPADSTICSCLNVTRGELTDAILAGASTSDALAAETGASTVCGSCRELVCELAGQPTEAINPKSHRGLLIASCCAAGLVLLFLALGPLPFAETVQSAWRQIDFLWQDSFAKQVTGYSLLAISLLGLLLSLRKRVSWFKLGEFGMWRTFHSVLGLATLLGFLVHTGLRLGHNFTFALALTFLLLNLLGAFTGIAAALESKFSGPWARKLRAWRPKLTQLHIWLLWPLPALILFHIISVYYY